MQFPLGCFLERSLGQPGELASASKEGSGWREASRRLAPAPAVTLDRGMWGQGGEASRLLVCKPLLFLTLLTKGDSSTAFRRLLIKSSLLLLGTYYISDQQDAQINKPPRPSGGKGGGREPTARKSDCAAQ